MLSLYLLQVFLESECFRAEKDYSRNRSSKACSFSTKNADVVRISIVKDGDQTEIKRRGVTFKYSFLRTGFFF